ncbi:MAG: hypothetical protein P8M80_15465, partial [Pirellulaceae bacterium]|nr:hypothetical protein [Pirellulaceae bacterium]
RDHQADLLPVVHQHLLTRDLLKSIAPCRRLALSPIDVAKSDSIKKNQSEWPNYCSGKKNG